MSDPVIDLETGGLHQPGSRAALAVLNGMRRIERFDFVGCKRQ